MNENYYNDEVEIDLVDLLFYLMRQWRKLVLAIVIGIIGGTALWSLMGILDAKKDTPEYMEAFVKEYKEEIETDVHRKMEDVYSKRQLLETKRAYIEQSPLMNLDASNLHVGELKCHISDKQSIALFVELYKDIIMKDSIADEVERLYGDEFDRKYLGEIVSCTTSLSDDTSVSFTSAEESSSFGYISLKDAVIIYRVYGKDKAFCESVLNVIKAEVDALTAQIRKEYKQSSTEIVSENYSTMYSSNILDTQRTYLEEEKKLEDEIRQTELSFEEADLLYYDYYYPGRENIQEEDSDSVLKWAVIGAFVLCLCWGAYYLVKYLMDSKVKSAEDIKSRYGLPVLGRVQGEQVQRNGIDGWIDGLDQKRKGTPDSISYVAAVINGLSDGQLLMTYDGEFALAGEMAEKIRQECHDLTVGNYVHLDGESLEKAKTMDGIILLVIEGQTEMKQVRREIEVCKMQGIPVVGVVVVE